MRTPQYVARAGVASYAAQVTTRASVVRNVPARVGLVGNPSDGYAGAVLATVVPGLAATVTAVAADHLSFEGDDASSRWASMSDWRTNVRDAGHGHDQKIISAALWTLDDYLRRHQRRQRVGRGVALKWSTDIPRSVGLAGSSALAVGVIDATATLWQVELDRRVVAALALRAERDVLGIAAGWQDRIVQSFSCTVLVDSAQMEVVDGLLVPHVQLPSVALGVTGSLVVAWADHVSSPSGDYHAEVRLAGEALGAPMSELAGLARQATKALTNGALAGVAAAMDAGWLIRQRCAPLRSDHGALVEAVRDQGIAATTPGSGGSVVAMCLDESAVAAAVGAVERAGCTFVRFTFG